MIRLARIAPDVETLGPGVRFCIWVQGCKRGCRGCMSRETWDMAGGYLMDEAELAARMLEFPFEGITISGGEPMLQCAALSRLIRLLREKRDVGVIVYTGYRMEELRAMSDPDCDRLLSQIDLMIDGEYIEEQDDDGALRGSANQRAWHLTGRYRAGMDGLFGKIGAREQQLQIDEQGVLWIGLREKGKGR